MCVLLLGHDGVQWKSWLRECIAKGEGLVCLDPAEATQTCPGRFWRNEGGKLVGSRFFGSLQAMSAPHVVLLAAATLVQPGDTVLLPPYRPSPLGFQSLLLLIELLRPERVIVADGTPIDVDHLPCLAEHVEVESAFPLAIQISQRKAQWMKLIDESTPHEELLTNLTLEGVRLGSGELIRPTEAHGVGLRDALRVEVQGSTLFIIQDGEIEDSLASRALDHFHCQRLLVAPPDRYARRLAALAKASNEEICMAILDRIDFEVGVVHLLSPAEKPVPVKTLRVGALGVGPTGNELGELKPWQA
ncbi:MAG: hypothetical protein JST35_05860 [Armatimonadetes bacterium]|nr:hypothetical protein [Armatimonadota bacterium]